MSWPFSEGTSLLEARSVSGSFSSLGILDSPGLLAVQGLMRGDRIVVCKTVTLSQETRLLGRQGLLHLGLQITEVWVSTEPF